MNVSGSVTEFYGQGKRTQYSPKQEQQDASRARQSENEGNESSTVRKQSDKGEQRAGQNGRVLASRPRKRVVTENREQGGVLASRPCKRVPTENRERGGVLATENRERGRPEIDTRTTGNLMLDLLS